MVFYSPLQCDTSSQSEPNFGWDVVLLIRALPFLEIWHPLVNQPFQFFSPYSTQELHMQIVVLGTHRSGTSAFVRLINMMGASIGPAHLIGEPAPDNEKGFWERSDVRDLNDALLSAQDSSWQNIYGFDTNRIDPQILDEYLRKVRKIIFQMDTQRPWVVKDPRLCLTFPLWRPLFEVPVCVVVHRSPFQVARSLQVRNGLSLSHGVALWEAYTRAALSGSTDLPRIILSYARLMDDPVAVVNEMHHFFTNCEIHGLHLPSRREINAFVEQRLHHQRGSFEDGEGILNQSQRKLAEAMEDGSALAWSAVQTLSPGAAEVLESVRTQHLGDRKCAEHILSAREKEIEVWESLDRSVAEVVKKDLIIANLNNELAALRAQTADIRQALNQAQEVVESRNVRIADLEREIASAFAVAESQVAKVRELSAELAIAQNRSEEFAKATALPESLALVKDTKIINLTGQVAFLSRCLSEIDRCFGATLASWRWRIGNHSVRMLERLLLRPKPRLAADYIAETLKYYRAWQRNQMASPTSMVTRICSSPANTPYLTNAARVVSLDESQHKTPVADEPLTPDSVIPLPQAITTIESSYPDSISQKSYEIVCLPIIDWDFRFQRPQQLVRRFVQAGHRVYYVDLSLAETLALRNIEPGVVGVTLPGRIGTNVYRELPTPQEVESMVRALLEIVSAAERTLWVCLVQLPFWGPVAEVLRERTGCKMVYDCMDDHGGFSTNTDTMLAAEEHLLSDADLVIASSQVLLDKVAPRARCSLLIRNAADFPHFATVKSTLHRFPDQFIVGYYGAIADWFDSALVGELARLRPQWRFVLVGNTFSADLTPVEDKANISLLGEQPYAMLPALMADWDCCIIPFKRMPLTEATNPVKVYEMLAAGKPVVAVPLPELMLLASLGYISLAETAGDFALAIATEVTGDSLTRQAGRRYYARSNTWEDRFLALDAGIRELFPLVSILIVTYNNWDLNHQCLDSVLSNTDYPRIEVIVVDNGSTDATPELLRSMAANEPRLKVILNQFNKGFAEANNQALAIAAGDFLCLLNNDTVVAGPWLSTLVRHLELDPKIGLIGPVTNACGNEAQITVGYEQITDMPNWAKEHCHRHRGELTDISMLAFFCVVMPRAVYQIVGPLDERFAVGMFEDDDYNDRIRANDYTIKLAHDCFVHHWQKRSFRLLGEEEYLRIYRENQARYREKRSGNGLDSAQRRALQELRKRCESAPRVVLFPPSIGWNIHLFQRPHHLARAFAEHGEIAIFDCTRSGVDEVNLLREIEPNLFLFDGTPELLRDLPRITLWTFTYNYGYRDHLPPDVRVIYDWIDDLAVFHQDPVWLRALHDRAVREADIVASVARALHTELRAVRPDAIYLPNAVDADHFRHAPNPNPARKDKDFMDILAKGKPIAGYYGALAHWFDYELLGSVARLREDWEFVLLGTDYDNSLPSSGIIELPNVHWIGPRDYDVLPGYLHLFDVAIIPFKINEITLATSPLKLFEYFAGGRGVVTTPMPECVAFPEVMTAPTPDVFAQMIDRAHRLTSDPGYLDSLVPLVNSNTWSERVRGIAEMLLV